MDNIFVRMMEKKTDTGLLKRQMSGNTAQRYSNYQKNGIWNIFLDVGWMKEAASQSVCWMIGQSFINSSAPVCQLIH